MESTTQRKSPVVKYQAHKQQTACHTKTCARNRKLCARCIFNRRKSGRRRGGGHMGPERRRSHGSPERGAASRVKRAANEAARLVCNAYRPLTPQVGLESSNRLHILPYAPYTTALCVAPNH